MAVYKLMGSFNHSLIAHYTLGFGPQGFIAKLFPCELAIKKITDKHLEISLVTQPVHAGSNIDKRMLENKPRLVASEPCIPA